MAGSLLDRVIEASGLNEVVAPFTITRLLVRAGARPDALTADDLARALPELEQGIAVYLDSEELQGAVVRLRELARIA